MKGTALIRNTRYGLLSLAAATALVVSACGTTDTGGETAEGECSGKIAAMGALSGADASIVIPSVDGAALALEQWSKDNPDCDIELVRFDTEGSADKATPIATQVAGDDTFLGVIGGAFSGETRATKGIYDAAGLTMISQSATATDLTKEDAVPVFHRVVPYDEYQGKAIAQYIEEVFKAKKVFVIDNSEAYGEPLAAQVKTSLGDLVVDSDKTQKPQTDFAPTVSRIKQTKADAIMYGGYIAEAAPLLKQIRDAGIEAPFIAGDGVYGAGWGEAVGAAGDGAIVVCPCAPIDPEDTFAKDFEEKFGEAPGAYAAEGYDVMNIFLAAIEEGNLERADIEKFVDEYEGKGLSKDLAFDENGDVPADKVAYYAYKTEGGKLVPDQPIELG